MPFKLPDAYPCTVTDFAKTDRNERANQFPHNSTADIWYQAEQYAAFRDLGYDAAKRAFAAVRALDTSEAGYSWWAPDAIKQDNRKRAVYLKAVMPQAR